MSILITGVSGFIGHATCKKLLQDNNTIIGVDNLNSHSFIEYTLKIDRLRELTRYPNFIFYKVDIRNTKDIQSIFRKNYIQYIIHLAAQAGVRRSATNPDEVIDNNIAGFMNILDLSQKNDIEHLVYASSSSVYGNNITPSMENDKTDNQISIYGASKKSNELMAHVYSNIHKLPTTGVRLFTVYGPWARPDMALYKFTGKIMKNESIEVYNNGEQWRDFTYIDDVVHSIVKLLYCTPENKLPYEIYNVGNGNPVLLLDFIKLIEKNLSMTANIKLMPKNVEEVNITHSNIDKLYKKIGYKPETIIEDGIQKFVEWYVEKQGF